MSKQKSEKGERRFSRRTFLKGAAAWGGAVAWGGMPALSRTSWAQAKKPIKLGGLFDLTGAFATESEDQRKAWQGLGVFVLLFSDRCHEVLLC